MSPADEVTDVAVRVARALERAGVEYMVGGSVASSAHGEPRATRDIDFAIRLTESAVAALVEACSGSCAGIASAASPTSSGGTRSGCSV